MSDVQQTFDVYPAIDVRCGRVVRLTQGDFAREQRFGDDPFALAREYAQTGAAWLHLVDLDAARNGGYALHALVRRVRDETPLQVQTGGGVRETADVEGLIEAGAARVVVGTLAVTHPQKVGEWLERFGAERICVALDVRKDPSGNWRTAIQGWTAVHDSDPFDALRELTKNGLRHVLSTDIDRDGMLVGPAIGWYETLKERMPALHVQGSGGIAELADVRALRSAGCSGAIIGRALLEGRFSLAEALQC